jgi:hypothetical protein
MGQGLVAVSQPVFSNAPARVSSAWFQKTAAAIGFVSLCGMFGMVAGQAGSPLVVEESTGKHLELLLAIQAAATVACAIATCFYFQSEPKQPPSVAEALRRRHQQLAVENNHESPLQNQPSYDFIPAIWKDIQTLMTDPQYILLLVSFGVGYGVNNAFFTLLNPWMAMAGFPGDETAGFCGSIAIVGGVIGIFVTAPILDMTQNYTQAIRWSFFAAFVMVIGVVFVLQPGSPIWLAAVAFFVMGMSQFPLLPICIDAAAAHTYPIPEELSSSGLQLVGQYLGIVLTTAMGYLLEKYSSKGDDDNEMFGFAAPVNIVLLALMGLCAVVAFCYSGADPRTAMTSDAHDNDLEETLISEAHDDNDSPDT